jgi:nicotinamidase-related amidase
VERAYGLSIPRTLEEACDPRRTALLVYDMQVGVLAQIADADKIVTRVVGLVEAARQGGYQLRTAMAWQHVDRVSDVRMAFLRDSEEFALAPQLSPSPAEMIFDKITMSAFVGTPLDLVLRDCGIDTFAIAGVAMEVGIEPTVRHAADLGYLPIVVTDACGAGNAEAAQRSLAGLSFAGDALLTDTETIRPLLAAGATTRP